MKIKIKIFIALIIISIIALTIVVFSKNSSYAFNKDDIINMFEIGTAGKYSQGGSYLGDWGKEIIISTSGYKLYSFCIQEGVRYHLSK